MLLNLLRLTYVQVHTNSNKFKNGILASKMFSVHSIVFVSSLPSTLERSHSASNAKYTEENAHIIAETSPFSKRSAFAVHAKTTSQHFQKNRFRWLKNATFMFFIVSSDEGRPKKRKRRVLKFIRISVEEAFDKPQIHC